MKLKQNINQWLHIKTITIIFIMFIFLSGCFTRTKEGIIMIDPTDITIYDATYDQLEELILFWVSAAGKNGVTASKCLDKLLKHVCGPYGKPMESIFRANSLYDLPSIMKYCGMGYYTSKSRTFVELATKVLSGRFDLKTCSTEELEEVYGIGMKTSRCFIIHTRRGARYAGLDTHLLKHLKEKGVENVPKSTPNSRKEYLRLEKEFLKLVDDTGMEPAAYDLMIWNKYSTRIK